MQEHRKHAARLANRAKAEGRGDQWFEEFYQWANQDEAQVPWADLRPHPLIPQVSAASALVIGAGLGDDAEHLAKTIPQVTAIDISPTAINWAKQRFPNSAVIYQTADLFTFNQPAELVLEVYTLQALPPEIRPQALHCLATLTQETLIIITRIRTPDQELGAVPWPLLAEELEPLTAENLKEIERTAGPENQVLSIWKRMR